MATAALAKADASLWDIFWWVLAALAILALAVGILWAIARCIRWLFGRRNTLGAKIKRLENELRDNKSELSDCRLQLASARNTIAKSQGVLSDTRLAVLAGAALRDEPEEFHRIVQDVCTPGFWDNGGRERLMLLIGHYAKDGLAEAEIFARQPVEDDPEWSKLLDKQVGPPSRWIPKEKAGTANDSTSSPLVPSTPPTLAAVPVQATGGTPDIGWVTQATGPIAAITGPPQAAPVNGGGGSPSAQFRAGRVAANETLNTGHRRPVPGPVASATASVAVLPRPTLPAIAAAPAPVEANRSGHYQLHEVARIEVTLTLTGTEVKYKLSPDMDHIRKIFPDGVPYDEEAQLEMIRHSEWYGDRQDKLVAAVVHPVAPDA